MRETIRALKDILRPLFENQTGTWLNQEPDLKPSCQILNTFRIISEKWKPITFEEIAYLFDKSELTLDFAQRVLYLPALQKKSNFVPILSLFCKLNGAQSIAQFRVMLVTLDKNHETLNGIGFRMETPESRNQNSDTAAKDGIHDFFHAQLIQNFSRTASDGKPEIYCPDWLPESQPSFPLPADCPVTLLLCLIVTLYGRNYYNHFLKTHGTAKTKQYEDKLDIWINPDQLQEKQREETKKQLKQWQKRKLSKLSKGFRK